MVCCAYGTNCIQFLEIWLGLGILAWTHSGARGHILWFGSNVPHLAVVRMGLDYRHNLRTMEIHSRKTYHIYLNSMPNGIGSRSNLNTPKLRDKFIVKMRRLAHRN